MKKLIAMLLILVCVLVMVGCDNTKQTEITTYSFRGEHDYFAISNGTIVLSDTDEIFDGGDLHITQSDVLNEIASYSTTFYTIIDGERRTILSNSVIDQTGSAINVEGDLGKSSGKGVIIGSKVENIDELKDNLWFELETTDLDGKENVYQIQLTFSN
ncbi:MAG: hypothetical protein J6B87_01420 [Clostridia bacterium]|nr:hypothetical protein [Clostridia bacterium]